MSPRPLKLTVGAVRLSWESFCYLPSMEQLKDLSPDDIIITASSAQLSRTAMDVSKQFKLIRVGFLCLSCQNTINDKRGKTGNSIFGAPYLISVILEEVFLVSQC